MLGLSLNLVVGYSGLLSLCHAAFYGIGAYTSTLIILDLGWDFFPAAAAGIVASLVLGAVIGLPLLRLKGDFFVLATMGFQMIVVSIFHNWVDLTRGPYGIPGIPRPSILGWKAITPLSFMALTIVVTILVIALHWQITRSPFGRSLQAIRDDDLAATALGKNSFHFKFMAFIISGSIAALAGTLFAGYLTYIEPTSFGLEETILILSAVIIGGAGNLRGPVLGAVFVVVFPEALRFLQVPDAVAPNVRQIVYGIILVLIMRLRPQGIAGRYAFE